MTRSTSILIRACIVAALTTASVAYAGVGQNIGGGISTFDNGISFDGTGGFTPSGCGAGQLDFSDGCGTLLYMGLIL